MKIVDVGHTVQVVNTGTNTITVNGKTYTVAQFHFHHRSEHTINGRSYPLEMHVVSADPDPATNTNVVLAVFFEESTTDNAFLAKVFNNIPTQQKQQVQTQEQLSLGDILPADPHYYTYVGSLTTPPCTAGVDWVIFQQPMTLSTAQLAQFTSRYPSDARPTQPLKTRVIYQN
jgi:carbonic anhydrase